MIQIRISGRAGALLIGAALCSAMAGLACAEAQSDQSPGPAREKPARIMPGTQSDVVAPPHVGDTDLNKGTPPANEFPTPVIRPPANPAPVPAKPE